MNIDPNITNNILIETSYYQLFNEYIVYFLSNMCGCILFIMSTSQVDSYKSWSQSIGIYPDHVIAYVKTGNQSFQSRYYSLI